VLVLNTFVDSVLAVRGVALAIRLSRAPLLTRLEFVGLEADATDNDGDGLTDEAGEGLFDPFAATPQAHVVEVPTSAFIRVTLKDPDGLSRAAVRLTLDGQLFTDGSEGLSFEEPAADTLVVTLKPPGGLRPASIQTLVVAAGDAKLIANPAPEHLSFMRDEEVLFTVKGAGQKPWEVRRPRLDDKRTRPPPIAFALTRSATSAGQTLLAQHFALLDANTAHKHTVVLVHHPDDGSPAYATVGWAGVAYGLAGMSARGLGYACNPSDTLDNSVVGSLIEQIADLSTAKLLARGSPIGFVARRVLETAADADSALEVFKASKHAYGWNCVIADAKGVLRAVELDSDIFKNGGGVSVIAPHDLDAHGARIASRSDDDLIAASAFQLNTTDIATLNLGGQRVVPQRAWSSFFYRSLRVAAAVDRKLDRPLDVEAVEGLLADPELVDTSDSMTAAVLELSANKLHYALGEVPATLAPFETLDLNQVDP
jgi:hypothetical protein